MTPEAPDRLVRSPSNSSPAADIQSLQHPGTPSIVRPTIPDHELLKKIGGGSYGEVWLARNILGAYRAVKIVYRSSFDHDRPFEREFAGIQKFEPISRTHESQVDILHVGRGEGYFYYVMELADGAETVRSNGVSECRSDANQATCLPSQHSTSPSLHDSNSYLPRTL